MLELERLIIHHKALYYQGRPEISDGEFDQLENELKKLDPSNPVLQMVGGETNGEKKVRHQTKMLSLDKTYSQEELKKWIGEYDVVSMFKVDGVSCSLIYENGEFVLGKTRGDGVSGENISKKILWMESVPKKISRQDRLEIRGEMFCSEENFFRLSEEMVQMELERPTSPRNIVAGLMGRKDHLELCRYIDFKAFDLISEKKDFSKEWEKLKAIKKLGFDVLEANLHRGTKGIDDALNTAQEFMSEGDYQIDGLVFSYNDLELHEEMGATAHHPRYKLAFKFQGESKETSIESIEWSVSRNGILTPIAIVEPVELSGAKISRVTLHNYGLVKQYSLKAGDRIEIIRSGEVIPKFLSVVKESSNPFIVPEKCPSCNSKVVTEDIRLFCRNSKCPAVIVNSILNFIQKIGMDDISNKRLEEMITKGLVASIPDLYKLKEEDFLKLEKVKEKLAAKMFATIKKTKKINIITFLSALGISGGAYNKCEKVVDAGFNTIEKLKNLTVDQLEDVDSFAEKSATEFVGSLETKWEIVDSLLALGIEFEEEDIPDTAIAGKSICITGALSEKRSVVEGRVREAGGKISSSVSKNTDFLVTNDTSGDSSKLKKARDLGIKIISESELLDLLSPA